MTDWKDVAERIKAKLRADGIERVLDASNHQERDDDQVCRVCVIGGVDYASDCGSITYDENDGFWPTCCRVLRLRDDNQYLLKTVPDMPAVFQVYDEAAALLTEQQQQEASSS